MKTPTIALFDSGIGGLSVLRSLVREIPSATYVYLGDTARTPYGTKGSETIVRYSQECANYLLGFVPDALVVACNTASSYALRTLSALTRVPVIGTVETASREAVSRTRGKIGVIATEATVRSEVYTKRIVELDSRIEVRSQACPLFVPLVEQGMFDGEIVDATIKLYLAELRSWGIDTLVLGCTHYPMLEASLKRFLGDEVAIVTCSDAVAREVAGIVGGDFQGQGSLAFFVTDDAERFSRIGKLFLSGVDLEAEVVKL